MAICDSNQILKILRDLPPPPTASPTDLLRNIDENETENQNNNSLALEESLSNNDKSTKGEEFQHEKEKIFEFGMTIEALSEIGEYLSENNANETIQSKKILINSRTNIVI